jgi:hypothetical protein
MSIKYFFFEAFKDCKEISLRANKTKKLDNNRFKLSNTEGKNNRNNK